MTSKDIHYYLLRRTYDKIVVNVWDKCKEICTNSGGIGANVWEQLRKDTDIVDTIIVEYSFNLFFNRSSLNEIRKSY